MARGKKIHFDLEGIKISFRCSKCNKIYEVEVGANDFVAWEDPCELCGNHGGLLIDVKCPGCSNFREIELRSW